MKKLLEFILIWFITVFIVAGAISLFLAIKYVNRAQQEIDKPLPSTQVIREEDNLSSSTAESTQQPDPSHSDRDVITINKQDANGNWKYIDKYCNPMPDTWSPTDQTEHDTHLNPNYN